MNNEIKMWYRLNRRIRQRRMAYLPIAEGIRLRDHLLATIRAADRQTADNWMDQAQKYLTEN